MAAFIIMDGAQFNINVVTGGSNGAITSIVAGLDAITNHLNTLNKNFVSASQQNVAALDKISAGATKTESSISKMGGAVFHLNQIQQGLSGVANDLNNAIEPGIKLESSLKDLQAITGVTDAQLNKIGDSARKNAVAFGISAAGGVESYKIYLSKLGPELANSAEALDGMGRNAAILSKQMKGDSTGAAELLSSAMNQFGVSIKDPNEALMVQTRMMNIMSAAAQEGSAELPQIKSAIEQSGAMAKASGLNFAELNAAIQVVGKSANKYGSEGGVAVRNALAEMNQGLMNSPKTIAMLEAAGINVQKLSDRSVSFSDRMRMLAPIANDAAAMTQLFGKEGVVAGMAFAKNAAELDIVAGKIEGTSSATDMAKTAMSSYEEKMNRMKAAIQDYGISLFNATKPYMPFITMGMGAIQVMANMAMAGQLLSTVMNSTIVKSIGSAIVGMTTWIGQLVIATAAQFGLNIAMAANPVGIIVLGIAAFAAGLVIAYNKSESFRAAMSGLMEVGKLFMDVFVGVGKVLMGAFTLDIDMIKEGAKQAATAVVEIASGGVGKAFEKGYNESMAASAAAKESDKQKESANAASSALADLGKPIAGIDAKGVLDTSSPLAGYDPSKKNKKEKSGSTLSSNITSGGSKATTIHLTIQKVIGIGEVKTTNMMNTAKQAGNMVVEEVLVALQSVNGKVSVQ